LHGLPIALKDLLHIEGRYDDPAWKSWRGRIATETARRSSDQAATA
jgi:hypothetical protein